MEHQTLTKSDKTCIWNILSEDGTLGEQLFQSIFFPKWGPASVKTLPCLPTSCTGGEDKSQDSLTELTFHDVIEGTVSCWSWYAPLCVVLACILFTMLSGVFKKLKTAIFYGRAQHMGTELNPRKNEIRRKRKPVTLVRRCSKKNDITTSNGIKYQHGLGTNSYIPGYHVSSPKQTKKESIADCFPCPDLMHICPFMSSNLQNNPTNAWTPHVEAKENETDCFMARKCKPEDGSIRCSTPCAESIRNVDVASMHVDEMDSNDEEWPRYLEDSDHQDTLSKSRNLSESFIDLSFRQCDTSVSTLQKSFEVFGQEEVSIGQFIVLAFVKHIYNKLLASESPGL